MAAGDFSGALIAYRRGRAIAIEAGSSNGDGANAAGIIAATLAPPAATMTPECHELVERLYDTRHWIAIWTAVRAIASWLTRAGAPDAAATMLRHLTDLDRRHPRTDGDGAEPSDATALPVNAETSRESFIRDVLDQIAQAIGRPEVASGATQQP